MKRIEAVIRREKLDQVKEALAEAGFPALTTYDVHGRGEQRGVIHVTRGREHRVDLLPKTKVEIVVADRDVQRVIDVVIASARTGAIGDGKLFVIPAEQVIRIRTGEELSTRHTTQVASE
ncbi:MAG: P-II family nitrogen regulator [Chloroflexota bacterium]